MRQAVFAAAFVLPLMTIPTAFAATAPATDKFVQDVAMSDMFEVESGRLATNQSQNNDVKAFAQRMIDDHTKTSDQLKALIKDKQIAVQLPTSLDDKHKANLDKLRGLSGAQFDQAYVPMQVDAHEQAVALFQAYADSGDNADVKQWAQSTLPTLKNHLADAKALNTEIGKTTPMAKNDGTTPSGAAGQMAAAQKETDVNTASAAKAKAMAPVSNIKFVTRQEPTDWSAQALIGRTVENSQGDNLGDINNVIVNEKGDVVAVTIGVGGFLGLGEKDVGVPFDALDFTTANASADTSTKPTVAEKKEQAADARAARYDTEHNDIRIVLNASKEQLEAAPEFLWLDQQTNKRAQAD